MQQINPTILSTPLSIYRTLQIKFATPDVNLELGNAGIIMHIRFSQQLPILSLTNAVDSKKFQELVLRVKDYLETKRVFRGSPIVFDHNVLEASRFSLSEPLSNWQEYRRFIHQNNGRSCTETLMEFLKNPAVLDDVNWIGLGPNQIDARATQDELAYFKSLLEMLRNMNQELRQDIITSFERHYPNIFQQLLNERATQERRIQLQEGESFYQNILSLLDQHVIGQEEAVKKMATSLATQRNLESNKVFLFVGPSGVGKTELAKAVARTRDNRFIILEMQTCQEEHHASKIFGSPPGYVGSTDKPSFAQEIDTYQPTLVSTEGSTKTYHISNLVILFDEFEKAHMRIKQSLLTLFDEGRYEAQYSQGSRNLTCRYLFKKCIIVNTSNLYKDTLLEAFSVGSSSDQIVDMFKQLNRDLPTRESLSSEMLSRMSVVPFGPIPRGESYHRIVRLKLKDFCDELKKEFACRLVDVEQEIEVISALENKLYGDGTDIRRFRRYFDDIKTVIYQNYQTWTPMINNKLTFYCLEGLPCIKVSTYIEEFFRYHDLGVPIQRLP